MFKTRVKLKSIESYREPDSNVFTLYITYAVRGRRNFTAAHTMCVKELQQIFPSSIRPTISTIGWADSKCKTISFSVKLLLGDNIIYKFQNVRRR